LEKEIFEEEIKDFLEDEERKFLKWLEEK